MRRRVLAVTFVGLLTLGACSSDGDGSDATSSDRAATVASDSAVAKATTCAELVTAAQPVFTTLFQDLVDKAQALSATELAAMADNSADSKLLTEFEAALNRDGAEIEDKANELECGEDDAKTAMCAAVAAVDGKGNVVAESMIAGMSGQCP